MMGLRNNNRTSHIDGVVTHGDYIFWHNANVVYDNIFRFLKEKFPEKIILYEFDNVDMFVFDERLPVEIQSTEYKHSDKTVRISNFEQDVEGQLRTDIKIYGKCWFFFDSEFHRYLKGNINRCSSAQFEWMYRYMKDDQLRVYTVSHEGKIKELSTKDLDFINKISITCDRGRENDSRILTENKDIILGNILKLNKFNTDEIYKIRKMWNERAIEEKDLHFKRWCVNRKDPRLNLLGRILINVNNLNFINDVFNGNIVMNRGQSSGVILGIFESEGNRTGNRIKFVDYPNVAQYFPIYAKNKKKWDKYKDKWLSARQLEGIIKGNVDYDWWQELDKEHHNSHTINDEQTDKDKEVNVEIKSKGQIITINIRKDETAGW